MSIGRFFTMAPMIGRKYRAGTRKLSGKDGLENGRGDELLIQCEKLVQKS